MSPAFLPDSESSRYQNFSKGGWDLGRWGRGGAHSPVPRPNPRLLLQGADTDPDPDPTQLTCEWSSAGRASSLTLPTPAKLPPYESCLP